MPTEVRRSCDHVYGSCDCQEWAGMPTEVRRSCDHVTAKSGPACPLRYVGHVIMCMGQAWSM